jgi:hypothetical protein
MQNQTDRSFSKESRFYIDPQPSQTNDIILRLDNPLDQLPVIPKRIVLFVMFLFLAGAVFLIVGLVQFFGEVSGGIVDYGDASAVIYWLRGFKGYVF